MNPMKQTGTSIHVLNGEWYNEQCILLFLFIYLFIFIIIIIIAHTLINTSHENTITWVNSFYILMKHESLLEENPSK